jgi:hypothetical protein
MNAFGSLDDMLDGRDELLRLAGVAQEARSRRIEAHLKALPFNPPKHIFEIVAIAKTVGQPDLFDASCQKRARAPPAIIPVTGPWKGC